MKNVDCRLCRNLCIKSGPVICHPAEIKLKILQDFPFPQVLSQVFNLSAEFRIQFPQYNVKSTILRYFLYNEIL